MKSLSEEKIRIVKVKNKELKKLKRAIGGSRLELANGLVECLRIMGMAIGGNFFVEVDKDSMAEFESNASWGCIPYGVCINLIEKVQGKFLGFIPLITGVKRLGIEINYGRKNIIGLEFYVRSTQKDREMLIRELQHFLSNNPQYGIQQLEFLDRDDRWNKKTIPIV